jgi:hypothetical protein
VVGTILIVGACVLLATGRPFPGWWALLPITGSMLLIAAGPDAVVNRTILRNPVMVWIGLISYPLYLWHWPLLSYLHILCEPTPTKKLFALAAAIALAFSTYTLIEKRIRAAGNARKTTCALVGMIVVMLAVGYSANKSLIPRLYSRGFEGSAPGAEFATLLEHTVEQEPGVFKLTGTLPGTTLFLGDSHIAQYGARFWKLAKQEAVHTGIFVEMAGAHRFQTSFRMTPFGRIAR